MSTRTYYTVRLDKDSLQVSELDSARATCERLNDDPNCQSLIVLQSDISEETSIGPTFKDISWEISKTLGGPDDCSDLKVMYRDDDFWAHVSIARYSQIHIVQFGFHGTGGLPKSRMPIERILLARLRTAVSSAPGHSLLNHIESACSNSTNDYLERTRRSAMGNTQASLDADTGQIRLHLRHVQSRLSDLTRFQNCAHEAGQAELWRQIGGQIEETIRQLDLLQASLLISIMEQGAADAARRNEQEASAQADREQRTVRERYRDRRLAQWALALILPVIWLTFWSTTAAPSSASPWVVILGTLTAVVIGSLLARILAGPASDSTKKEL